MQALFTAECCHNRLDPSLMKSIPVAGETLRLKINKELRISAVLTGLGGREASTRKFTFTY